MTGRRGNFVIVLVVVVVLGLLGRKVIEHDDDDDNEKTVKRVKEWGRRKDENENEHEHEDDLGRGLSSLFRPVVGEDTIGEELERMIEHDRKQDQT
jgi:hypothetical protein